MLYVLICLTILLAASIAIKNKKIKGWFIICILITFYFLICYLVTRPDKFIEERSYISDTFAERNSPRITFTEPMKITVKTYGNGFTSSNIFIVSPVENNEIKEN